VTSRVAVITTVAGRHEHLLRQREGLRRSGRLPDEHVVVSMGDPAIRGLLEDEGACVVVDLEAAPTLPLARARNLGATEARRRGADVLVFLDVDCIPSAQLVGRYLAVADTGACRESLLCGQVNYLSADFAAHGCASSLERYSIPHPARPDLDPHDVVPTDDYDLFWSLSFAVSGSAWEQVGGFCEAYTGYGGEDTDFAQCAKAAGVAMHWVGGATAYHQFHPVSDPPVEHLADILRNAHTFAQRWGRWPMLGWLEAFERQGLVAFDQANNTWQLNVEPPATAVRPSPGTPREYLRTVRRRR
jgi:GT2 family glycosyltransferase